MPPLEKHAVPLTTSVLYSRICLHPKMPLDAESYGVNTAVTQSTQVMYMQSMITTVIKTAG